MNDNLPPLPEPIVKIGEGNSTWNKYNASQMQACACAAIERQSVPTLNALSKRRIYDAIRGAYDIGYSDARNAGARAGDSAPGYKGRDIEQDHGDALLSAINAQLAAAPQPQPARAFLLRDLEKELNVSVPELSLAIARRGMDNYSTNMEVPTEVIEAMRSLFAQPQPAQPAQERCTYCDGTGDVHSITGEWRGSCGCEAGKAQPQPVQEPVAEVVMATKPQKASPAWLPFKTVYAPISWLDRAPIGTMLYTSPQAHPTRPLTETQADALNTLCKMMHSGEEVEGDDGLAMLVPMDLWNEAQEAVELLIGEDDGTEAAHGITKGTT